MQNVLLAFPNEITSKQIAETLNSFFEEVQNHYSEPDRYVLIKSQSDAIFLRPCIDLKENYEEWFEENQKELVMNLQSFIEMQYRKFDTAKTVLRILSLKFNYMIIQFDDFHLTGSEFLIKIQNQPTWDWR